LEETRKVVEALMKVGPRFSDISRATGIPVSTIRYIILKRLPKLGLSIRPSINYGALGLQRYLVTFRSSYPTYYISNILDLLGEYAYLDYYTYLMTEKKFFAIFAIPPSYEKDFLDFLDLLESMNLIKEVETCKLTYMRPLPFMVEFFDFSRGVWIQDWISMRKTRNIPETPEYPALHPKIDKVDLILIAELQKGIALIKYNSLAQKFNLTRQTISKHYKHVKNLINLFTIFWAPHMNPQLLLLPLMVKVEARKDFREILLSIPFTYTEFRSEGGDYFAMLMMPNVGSYNTLKFLTSSLDVISIDFQDMEYSGKFTIQHNLFKNGLWINVFDEVARKLVVLIKSRSGQLR
jgi:DNA-binding Lrp family transcriptional regulator